MLHWFSNNFLNVSFLLILYFNIHIFSLCNFADAQPEHLGTVQYPPGQLPPRHLQPEQLPPRQ